MTIYSPALSSHFIFPRSELSDLSLYAHDWIGLFLYIFSTRLLFRGLVWVQGKNSLVIITRSCFIRRWYCDRTGSFFFTLGFSWTLLRQHTFACFMPSQFQMSESTLNNLSCDAAVDLRWNLRHKLSYILYVLLTNYRRYAWIEMAVHAHVIWSQVHPVLLHLKLNWTVVCILERTCRLEIIGYAHCGIQMMPKRLSTNHALHNF